MRDRPRHCDRARSTSIIVIEGPLTERRGAPEEATSSGIWINTEQVTFEGFPSYFHVLASGKLSSITNADDACRRGHRPRRAGAPFDGRRGYWDSAVFGQALVRLMTERGHFGVHEGGVRFLSDTAYAARLVLPHDIANGRFVARTYVFRNGALVAERSEGFAVQKMGFERFIYAAAVGSSRCSTGSSA